MSDFYSHTEFPRVVGAVDGTQIPIIGPSSPFSEPTFINRKGWHSLNCHIVCNSELKIFDLAGHWPGSTHDSYMLQQSQSWQQHQTFQNGWLLGDSAYPQLNWLMTPISRPTNSAELRYNISHTKARACIERCNGVLKSRFRCLTRTLNFNPKRCSKIIMSCACLHNLAISHNLQLSDETRVEMHDEIHEQDVEPSVNVPNGLQQRIQLVQSVFN